MRRYWNGFWMCQSMFCAIPCPSRIWDEEARPLMLLFLPVVGLEIGLIWYALAWACRALGVPELMSALAVSVYPFLVTGYLHLDGFMDVTDAVKSCRNLQRRREILKDSHVGSFAVIHLALLVLAQFVCVASGLGDLRLLIFIPVVSRCGSALAVTLLRPMSTSQYAAQNIQKAHAIVLVLMLSAAFTGALALCGYGAVALLGGCVGYLLALNRGYQSLEGMNGDISGYALTISELASLGTLAVLGGMLG